MQKTDENGTWESTDGKTWLLVAPSPLFEAERAAQPKPKAAPTLGEILIRKGILTEADLGASE